MTTTALRTRDRARAAGDESIPGTGLPALGYALVVTLSVGVFLLWDGPLWSASRGASHVGRFVVSYLVVIPLATFQLARLGRLSWQRLVTATSAVWALKLLVTAVMFHLLARGTASELHATPPPAPVPTAHTPADYGVAPSDFARGSIEVRVRRGGAPERGAAVFVEQPPPGAPSAEPRRVVLDVGHDAPRVYLVQSSDEVTARTVDGAMHTFQIAREGRFVSSTAVPASGQGVALQLPEVGWYDASCATHAGRARLVVVDHPYAGRTDDAGRFRLEAVPAGPQRLRVVPARGPTSLRDVTVAPDVSSILDVDLDGLMSPPSPQISPTSR